MTIETAIAIFVPMIALMFTVMSFSRIKHHDTSVDASERATLSADVRYIRTSIDEMKVDNKAIQKDVSDLTVKVAQIDASAKQAHKRIDDIMKG